MSFSDLGLNDALSDVVARLGYSEPTPIQQRAIPAVLDGADLLAAAQTGTGKTAAFTLPIVQILLEEKERRGRNPRALVLTPTRELAAQVAESVETYGGKTGIRSAVIFGGVSAVPQIKALRRGVDILIATPGRLLDHVQQGNVDLSDVDVFVLDEADRMLDMGFIPDIKRIIARLPEDRQSLLFSATFSPEIRKLARTFLYEPTEIDVAPRNTTAELIEQKLVYVAKSQKREFLSWMIGHNDWQQVLVFTRTKHGANRLCAQLTEDGLPSAALHGNKSQGARTKALANFKNGKVRVLVATDIAARGLDISQLPHVINYELPNVPEDYVHRIGRTGRAGVNGEALALICAEERPLLRDIQKVIGRQIPELVVEDFYLKPEKISEVAAKPAGRNPGNRSRPGNSNGKSRQNAGGSGNGNRGSGSGNGNRNGNRGGGKPGGGGRSRTGGSRSAATQ
ncbi:MAG: DEAD/DEAH box helicase [Burkholderiaceae bacterium]